MKPITRATVGAATVTVLSALLLFSGCVQGLKGLRFSHREHAGEAECTDCHSDSSRADHAVCLDCHEIDAANPSEECLMCHTEGDYAVESARPEGYADVTFDHGAHEDQDCQLCHAGAARSRKAGSQNMPTMKVCVTCHDGGDAPAECETCHDKLRKDAAPADHTSVWPMQHGTQARLDATSCAYCHQETGCEDCHKTRRPRSHSPAWKNSLHGIEAVHDRTACTTCHQADMCSRCHQTKPPSHYGPRFRIPLAAGEGHAALVQTRGGVGSCQVCHEPAFCARCHN